MVKLLNANSLNLYKNYATYRPHEPNSIQGNQHHDDDLKGFGINNPPNFK